LFLQQSLVQFGSHFFLQQSLAQLRLHLLLQQPSETCWTAEETKGQAFVEMPCWLLPPAFAVEFTETAATKPIISTAAIAAKINTYLDFIIIAP
jgi:hypothetical protein